MAFFNSKTADSHAYMDLFVPQLGLFHLSVGSFSSLISIFTVNIGSFQLRRAFFRSYTSNAELTGNVAYRHRNIFHFSPKVGRKDDVYDYSNRFNTESSCFTQPQNF